MVSSHVSRVLSIGGAVGKFSRIATSTLISAGLIAITSAQAQESDEGSSGATGAADLEPKIEEVYVTGSLLPKGDFVSKAPIATITSSQFEMSNAVNVENLINTMPQVVGGADRSSSFGQGIATANLRGLGENRTLVLINSRRFVPTFPDGGTVDLNFIPVGLIDRVEILTGGASAAYGSDAMAGVINFILKEETDGWEFNGGVEITERGDSEIYNFNLTNGGTFAGGKGSYLVHADYLEREPLFFTDRDITKATLVDSTSHTGALGLRFGANQFPITRNAGMLVPDFIGGTPNCCFGLFGNDGAVALSPFVESDTGPEQWGVPDGSSNFGNVNGFSYLQLPQERTSFKGKVSYDFGKVEAYADIYYSKSKVPFSWGGPFIGFPTSYGYTASVENNPFWNDQTKQLISANYFIYNLFLPQRVEYRDANQNGIADTLRLPFLFRIFSEDVGTSDNPRTFESVQFEFGFKGDLSPSWGYEVYAQLGEVESVLDPNPLLNPERIQQGLLLTADGQCQDTSNGCVPLNIWGDDIGPDAAAFITYPRGAGRSVTTNEQNVVMATLAGNTSDWFTLPGDPGPIGLVLGAEYLEINAKIDTPEFIEQQQFEGFSNSPFSLDASTDITSIFGEALVPLVAGKPGIDFLELELGWRFSEHSLSGSATTYKAAVAYYPNPDVQVRASYNAAVRSPAINELFRTSQFQYNFAEDPCTQPGPQANVAGPNDFGPILIDKTPELAATCVSTGIPEGNLYNPLLKEISGTADQGGNEGLSNEEGKTYSLGVVWTPYSIDGLSMSLDYFHVEIENYITTTPVDVWGLIRNCYDPSLGVGGPGSASCGSLGRDADGRLNYINVGYRNLGLHRVRGFDLNIDYGLDFFSGYLDINYFATKIQERSIRDDTFGEVDFRCVGQFNGDCDNLIDYPVFDFKHRMTAGWSKGDVDLQLVWRLNGSLSDADDSRVYYREKLSTYSVFDLSGQYQISDGMRLTLGVRNMFDEQPEAIGSNSWELNQVTGTDAAPAISNTYTQYYDVYGRTYFAKLALVF